MMKNRNLKNTLLLGAMLVMSIALYAVPARRSFHDCVLTDGTTVSLTLVGDEFGHWYEAVDGTIYRQKADGTFECANTTRSEMNERRKQSPKYRTAQIRRARHDVGVTPNLAPKGIVVMANFSNKAMQAGHTHATFDELCNSANCTVNNGYPSAREYFKSQSNGAYAPVFDVYGPVTLSRPLAYYGTDLSEEGDDEYATDAVVEACILANQQFDINWADYDSDNDGYVDFVYVIYAGQGQADGGASTTIWPHNWDVTSAISEGYCTYTDAQRTFNGKKVDNYAMSSELSGTFIDGIGTLCHEFGHVMGLPDLYDTEYDNIYNAGLTPNDWNIMDGGSYNADGHCPPNYDPWQKYFFGWHTPINLGNEGQVLTLQANGTTGYQAYQINASGTQQNYNQSGVCYYIENRQPQGWDAPLTGHGLLIWKINFNQEAWENNAPNNTGTTGSPLYTVVSADGTKIGTKNGVDYCPRNTFPGSKNKTSWNGVSGKPLLNISEANGIITLTYIEEPVEPVEPFELIWRVGNDTFAITTSTGRIVMPSYEPDNCGDKVFVGWCRTANYQSETTAPVFVTAGQPAQEGDIFYAVFATQEGEGTVAVSDVLTRAWTGVSGTTYVDWSGKTATSSAVYAGQSAGGNSSIQLRSKNSNSGIVTTASGGTVSEITVDWNSNTSSERKLDIYGKNTPYAAPTDLYSDSSKGTKIGSVSMGTTSLTVTGDYRYIGVRSNSGALYMNSLTITWGGDGVSYSGYTTTCTGESTCLQQTEVQPVAMKIIRNGQLIIIRNGQEYDVLGR